MGRNADRRRRWFDEGVSAVERVIGKRADGYLCPLCLRWMTVDEVSLEDAPPQSVGGRQVALTCRECNSRAGHRLERHLRTAEDIRDWAARRTSRRPIRGELEFEGVRLRIRSQWIDGRLEIYGMPGANNPADTAAHMAALEASPNRFFDSEFKLHYDAPNWQRVQVAWLKQAFVASFAVLEYRWALRSALDVVRTQIDDPDTVHIPRFYLPRRSGTSDRKVILWIHKPRALECLWVVMHDQAVVLPGLKRSDPSARIYDRLNARTHWPLRQRTTNAMQWLTPRMA